MRHYGKFLIISILVLLAFATGLVVANTNNKQTTIYPVQFDFDDGCESTYTEAYPILEKYGITGTVYIVPTFIGESGYLNREQLQELVDAGWEIGSHTMTHPHLNTLDPVALEYELGASKAWFDGFGIEVNSFASPFGEYNDEVLTIVTKYYETHRTAWPMGINTGDVDPYALKVVATISTTTVEEVRDWVDCVMKEDGYLILTFHRINEDGEYNWTGEQLEEIVQYVTNYK